MRGLALRVLPDPEAADDALQNAYIKAYQNRHTFRGDAELSTWLYTIVYRSCVDEHRRRRPTVPFDEAFSGFDGHGSRSGDAFETVGDRLTLRQALSRLAPAQRAAIWLVDAEGMTFAEAADILGLPPGTVASRVSRARAALRELLADEHRLPGGHPSSSSPFVEDHISFNRPENQQ